MNVTEQLKKIITNELDVNIKLEEIQDDASLFEEGIGLDSIAIVEFITLIESNFKFKFTDEELSIEPFKNLQTLSHFISSKINS
jgi:acyl carrier protein